MFASTRHVPVWMLRDRIPRDPKFKEPNVSPYKYVHKLNNVIMGMLMDLTAFGSEAVSSCLNFREHGNNSSSLASIVHVAIILYNRYIDM